MPRRPEDALSIGSFSALTQITARALRHYDRLGLLTPATIDPTNGYRYYQPGQTIVARRIRQLRELGIGLNDIANVFAASDPQGALASVLASHRLTLALRVDSDQRAIDTIDELLSRKESGMPFDISIRHLDPQPVATFRRRGTTDDSSFGEAEPWIALDAAVARCDAKSLASIGIANLFDLDGVVDLELGYVCDELVPPGDGYTSRVLDGGDFATLTYRQRAEKAAAYEALHAWLEAQGRRVRGPLRELHPLVEGMVSSAPGTHKEPPYPHDYPVEILCPVT